MIYKQLKANMCPISVRLQMDGKHWQLEHASKCEKANDSPSNLLPYFQDIAMKCNIYPQVQRSNRQRLNFHLAYNQQTTVLTADSDMKAIPFHTQVTIALKIA